MDFGLVLHAQEKWWIGWPSLPSLSHCYGSMVYCFGFIWSNWVMPHTVLGLLRCWQGNFGRHRNGYIWSIIPHCLMVRLWREINSRCFEDIERSILDLKLFFFRTLVDWLFALQKQSFPSFIDFLDSCNYCIWFLDPLYTPCVLGCSFLISIKLITY